MIPQSASSYEIEPSCQIENLGWLLEQLPAPFGKRTSLSSPGRLVEVGAFDGRTYSNTWGLIKDKWPAILIEPMLENVIRCLAEHKNRSWVIVEPVACGDSDGNLQLFFEREGSRLAKEGEPQTSVPMTTLNAVLRRHDWQPDFDMLVIDVEEFEQPVLRGFDLEFYRPKLCIIETYGWQREVIHQWFDKLYTIFYEDGLNTIFARRDWKT
jgi:FkbM family methyltransferase